MKNLLLVSIEDLNDWVEPLGGHPQSVTPNIRRLADAGVLCSQAYAASPACSSSRTSMLFSKYPWETGVYSNDSYWFDHFPYGQASSLLGHLKSLGMETIGAGKIFHTKGKATLDLSDWSEFHFSDKVKYPRISRSVKSGDCGTLSDFGIDPTGLPSFDDLNTDWMIGRIQPGDRGKAWALGIFRPHLPFIAPGEFFDKIPASVALPPGLGADVFDPQDERSHENLPQPGRRLAKMQAKLGEVLCRHGEYEAFLRAYLACICYADSKLGMVLDHLEKCDLLDDTLIVLWSDHGWQLGEKLAFRKFTLWERALRIPVVFAGAGLHAAEVRDPVSLVDLAPSILSLLGLPPCSAYSGQDLSPALRGTGALQRPYAQSVWGVNFKDKPKLAYTIRTGRYRYIRYWNGGRELYDHHDDPFEHVNLLRSNEEHIRLASQGIARELDGYIESGPAQSRE